MQDTAALRSQLAIAAARVAEDLEADGRVVADVPTLDLAERLIAELDDYAVILGAALGRGRTAAGDALADRVWAEIGLDHLRVTVTDGATP